MAKPHLETAFGAGGVTAVEDDGLGPVETDGASLLLVETLLFQLKRRQLFRKLLRVVFLHFARLAFGVGDNVDLLLDGFSAFALFPPGAAVGAGVLMMARVELDVGRRLFAEGASRQFRAEGLAQEVDDFLRGARRVGDVQGRVAFVVAVADFQPLFDGELETGRLAILDGPVEDGLSVRPLGVDVGPVAQQVFERLDVVAEGGVGQRRRTLQIPVVDVDAVANGEVDPVEIAAGRGVMQDGFAHVAATVQVGTVLDQKLHEGFALGAVAGGVKGGVAAGFSEVEIGVEGGQDADDVESVVPTRVIQRTDPVLVQVVDRHASEQQIDDFPRVSGDGGGGEILRRRRRRFI